MKPSASPALITALVAAFAVVIALVVVLSLVSLTRPGALSVLPTGSQQTGIGVCGHGTAKVRPDRAQIGANVTARAPTAEAARAQAAQAMAAVLAALKSNGVADQDIQTGYVAIQPEYTYPPSGQPIPIGYLAINSVSVTIRSVDNTSQIVDAVTQAGGNSVAVSGIQFSVSDPTPFLAQAEQNAVVDARRQAEQVAQKAEVRLGAPLSIQIGGCGAPVRVPFPLTAGAASDKNNTPTPIQPGQVEVAADVGVVYAIR
jgi:uncharacterized protein YggE